MTYEPLHSTCDLLHVLAHEGDNSVDEPQFWAQELSEHAEILDDLKRSPRHWLSHAKIIGQAHDQVPSDSPFAEPLNTLREHIVSTVFNNHTSLRLWIGGSSGFPYDLVATHGGRLDELPTDDAIQAWIAGSLGAADAKALKLAVTMDGKWRNAYRNAVLPRLASLVYPHYQMLPPVGSAWSERGPEVLRVYLPHLGDDLVIRLHVSGLHWTIGNDAQLIHYPANTHLWNDPVLGEVSMTLLAYTPSALDDAMHAAREVARTASEPDASLVKAVFTSMMTWAFALEAAASVVPQHQHKDEHKGESDDLYLWVLTLVELRIQLDRQVAELDWPELTVAMYEVDTLFSQHKLGVLMVGRDTLEELLLPGEFLDPYEWWGAHARTTMPEDKWI